MIGRIKHIVIDYWIVLGLGVRMIDIFLKSMSLLYFSSLCHDDWTSVDEEFLPLCCYHDALPYYAYMKWPLYMQLVKPPWRKILLLCGNRVH